MNAKARAVPIPPKLQARPRWRNLPIPFVALIGADGEPDFRAVDEGRRLQTAANRVCQLCGFPLGRNLFFVGGPAAAEARNYFEPPAHLECVVYAMQVCPFILGQVEHADPARVAADHAGDVTLHVDPRVLPARVPLWRIVKATDFRLRGGIPNWYFEPLGEPLKAFDVVPEKMGPADWVDVRERMARA